MKKQNKIKAWIWLCKTEMPWISTKKPSKNEIENAKNFYVKILPCEIIIKEKQNENPKEN